MKPFNASAADVHTIQINIALAPEDVGLPYGRRSFAAGWDGIGGPAVTDKVSGGVG
jgi:hypothetical protein